MELGLKNKKVLVTGSTKGIGKAIAAEFAREGADVVINGRSEADVQRVVSELRAKFKDACVEGIAADIAKEADREAMFKKLPTVDILVNNMGIFEPMEYFDITDEIWEKFFRVNVMSGNALCKFYLPCMLKRDFGRIVFIASEEALMPSGQMPQ